MVAFTDHHPQVVREIGHRIIRTVVGIVKIEYLDDVGMPQAGHGDGLGHEHCPEAVHPHQLDQKWVRVHVFERGDFTDNRVLDLVYLAHAATTEEAANDVFPDGFHIISSGVGLRNRWVERPRPLKKSRTLNDRIYYENMVGSGAPFPCTVAAMSF